MVTLKKGVVLAVTIGFVSHLQAETSVNPLGQLSSKLGSETYPEHQQAANEISKLAAANLESAGVRILTQSRVTLHPEIWREKRSLLKKI